MSPPAEAINAANRLAEVVEQLRGDLHEATAAFEKSRVALEGSARRQRWFLILIVAVLALVAWLTVSNRVTAHKVAQQTVAAQRQAACVRAYANQNADRAALLYQPAVAQQLALADAFRSLLPFDTAKTRAQQQVTEEKFLIYLQKSDAYQHLVQTTPLPLPPKFSC